MKQWLVKKGNTSIQDIPVYKKDGVTLVDNLAIATEIKFQIKKDKKDAVALVEKTAVLFGQTDPCTLLPRLLPKT